jgi:hypothetical protein
MAGWNAPEKEASGAAIVLPLLPGELASLSALLFQLKAPDNQLDDGLENCMGLVTFAPITLTFG